jgi:four helix bundle protein
MNYQSWLAEVPDSLKRDPVWKFVAYPKALWLFDLVWVDCEKLKSNQQGRALINQLIRSTDSISANIDEGYGRGVEHKEYAYYLRVALGSTRETRSRYFKVRQSLPNDVVQYRIGLCNEIIGLLVNAINNHRLYLKRLKLSNL